LENGALTYASAAVRVNNTVARSIEPRKVLTVSQWADAERFTSSKEGPIEGQWDTNRNPPLREPMDCMSRGSGVHEMCAKLPIQFGKTNIEVNVIGYAIDHDPCPMIVFLPDDLTKDAWTLQKFNPMIENTPAVRNKLTTTASRSTANQAAFKDFLGGQIFVEHGKTATRMSLKTARRVLVDEIDKFVAQLATGEDPLKLIRGRVSAFPSSYQIAYVGSPGVRGVSRMEELWEESDQREYHVPCPHCGVMQPLTWSGLQWTPNATDCWYVCRYNGCVIREASKTEMIARGHWVAKHPGRRIRGYHINCLYYQFGLGPRWLDLVREWIDAQKDLAALQVFVQERLAEAWEDPALRRVKHNVIADRAEPYKIKHAPRGVIEITAGVDVQGNRLVYQIVGWGRGNRSWTLDYDELFGNPIEDDGSGNLAPVWTALTDRLNRAIEHECGAQIRIASVAIDMRHCGEDVKMYVRRNLVRRPMAIYGAKANNAPPLGKPKLVDLNWRGQSEKRGLKAYQVGTVEIKQLLYRRLAADGDPKKVAGEAVEKTAADRLVHFSEELGKDFFAGIVSEVFDPKLNRFVKRKGGVRNEPLDTWAYACAASMHPELRLHRRTLAEWDAAERRLGIVDPAPPTAPAHQAPVNIQPRNVENVPRGAIATSAPPSPFGSAEWLRRR
jgi:phage terminase large subunit GpA-like protein